MPTAAGGVEGRDRVPGFDLLRGLCALAVLVYHGALWSGLGQLHNWGTYAVYAFFVLSGASMVVAYGDRFAAGYPVTRFLALRLVRLLPLFLLALAAAPILLQRFDLDLLAYGWLNVLFLFGFGNPGATSPVTGGWSLGIEFVFYLVFPAALALASTRYWPAWLAIAFATQHVFIELTLRGATLESQWSAYTQFLAFIFYFAAGCTIGQAVRERWLAPHAAFGLVLAAMLLVLGGANGSSIEAALTGWAGILLSLATVLAVAASAFLPRSRVTAQVGDVLGRGSYGMYLLHPLLFPPLQALAKSAGLGPVPTVLALAALTLPLALLLERFFEHPLQVHFKRVLQGPPRVETLHDAAVGDGNSGHSRS